MPDLHPDPKSHLLLTCKSSRDPVDLPIPALKLGYSSIWGFRIARLILKFAASQVVDAQLKVYLNWCLNGPSAI